MTRNIDFLTDIYHNAEMGIIGVNEVLYKIKDCKLKKEIEKEKRGYKKILSMCDTLFKKYNDKPKKIGFMTKMSSEFMSEMKLSKENSDDIILKMMIEGSYKSIGILTTKLMEFNDTDSSIQEVAKLFLKMLNDNIKQLKNFDKIC